MEIFFSFICIYLNPIFSFLFCFSLIRLIKKIHLGDKKLGLEQFLLTSSFILIIWSISFLVGSV